MLRTHSIEYNFSQRNLIHRHGRPHHTHRIRYFISHSHHHPHCIIFQDVLGFIIPPLPIGLPFGGQDLAVISR